MNLWNESFLEAARSADEATLKMLLQAGVHPDVFDDDHVTALQIAAAQGNTTMIEILLSSGASVDRCNEVGMTALMHACRNGHLDTVHSLLNHNADRFRTTFYGVTALTLAIAGGHLEVVSLLQSARCPTQAIAPTPLVAAVAKRHHHIIIFLELISESPPFIDDPCLFGLDAVRVAQILKDEPMLELLSDLGVTTNVPPPNNRFIPSITFEAHLSYIKCDSMLLPDIRFLIRDEKVHQLDKMLRRKRRFAPLPPGSTPLMFAAVIGNVDMARILLRNGENLNASLENFTPLMIAIVCGNDAMVNYLLDMGASETKGQQVSNTELAAESEGIRETTRERIEKGFVTPPSPKSKKKSFVAKLVKLLKIRRKKIQTIVHCAEVSFYGRMAFRERVHDSMGKGSYLVPPRLFHLLDCIDCSEYQEETVITNQKDSTKRERILDTFSDDDINRLFRRRNCHTPIPHRNIRRFFRPNGESSTRLSVQNGSVDPRRPSCSGSSTNTDDFELTRLDWDGSQLSRKISELRANFFSFDSSNEIINRRHVSFKLPPKRTPKSSPNKRNVRYWQNIRERCCNRTCEILKIEEVDEACFVLMQWDDFVDMGVPECDIERLEELREEMLTPRAA